MTDTLTPEKLEELKALALAATPGPWRWEVSLSAKQVELCGGPPKSGFGKYDHAVMSFRRWGMGGAAPVFWSWTGHMGTPRRADELATPVEGREHHASWFRTIDDPNAAFIAAANPACILALISQAEAREQEVADLTKALTGLTCGGSEFFIRRGDRYIADIKACVEYVKERDRRSHERWLEVARKEKAAKAQAEAREGEIARLRDLVEYALSVEVGITTAHDMKQNGWQWPENAPQTVTVFSERLRRALAREGDVS